MEAEFNCFENKISARYLIDPGSSITLLKSNTQLGPGKEINASSVTGERISDIIKLDGQHSIKTQYGDSKIKVHN
jgi:hypothetical protein